MAQKALLVKDIMSKELHSITSKKSAKDAGELMKKYHVGALPVIDDKNLVGIITERDLLNHIIVPSLESKNILVKDIMTKIIVTIEEDAPYFQALREMTFANVKKIIILSDGKPIGILTETDILKTFSKRWADDF